MISKAMLRARVLLTRLSRTELNPRRGVIRSYTQERSTKFIGRAHGAAVSTCAGDREANLNCPLFRLDRTPLIDQLNPRNMISLSIKAIEVSESAL